MKYHRKIQELVVNAKVGQTKAIGSIKIQIHVNKALKYFVQFGYSNRRGWDQHSPKFLFHYSLQDIVRQNSCLIYLVTTYQGFQNLWTP